MRTIVSSFRFTAISIFLSAGIFAAGALGQAQPQLQSQPKTVRLLFTGDILLSRDVASEWQRRKLSPWIHLADFFRGAQWLSGNFEGALGSPAECVRPAPLCFAVPDSSVVLLKTAGFSGVTFENNHAGDLGLNGRERTRKLLQAHSLAAVSFDNSPHIVQVVGTRLALVSLTLISAADGRVQRIPSSELAKKLVVARERADLVVVSIHWGAEYQKLPGTQQRAQARWLVQHGADLIVGHHPHVVQPAECIDGHPVFFSLGNHVFDQTYPPTKEGLIAECRLTSGKLACQGIPTRTDDWTTYPRLDDSASRKHSGLMACPVTVAQSSPDSPLRDRMSPK